MSSNGGRSFTALFDELYANGLGVRAHTFRRLFELLEEQGKPSYTLVETGIAHTPLAPLPWRTHSPQGHSTVLFDHFLRVHDGALFSIDLVPEFCDVAKQWVSQKTRIVCGDSREFLRSFHAPSPVDCLYLDSKDIVWEDPHPSALLHMQELCAVLPQLSARCLVCVDDSPGLVGKGGYIADVMERLGARLLFDDYQAGWLLCGRPPALRPFCDFDEVEAGFMRSFSRARRYRLLRGSDRRVLELLPDGTVGRGRDACQELWFPEHQGGGQVGLVLAGGGRVSGRLSPGSDGVWRGSWSRDENVPLELHPLPDGVSACVGLGEDARRVDQTRAQVEQQEHFLFFRGVDGWPVQLLPEGVLVDGGLRREPGWSVGEAAEGVELLLHEGDGVRVRLGPSGDGGWSAPPRARDEPTLRIEPAPTGQGAYLAPLFRACLPRAQIRLVVELGAGTAADTVDLLRYFKARVVSFECEPLNARACAERLKEHPSATLVVSAVGEIDGTADFHSVVSGNRLASSRYRSNPDYPYERLDQETVRVPMLRFETWAARAGLGRVDLLCIDLQGGCLPALQGMGVWLDRTRFIITEIETRPIYQGEALAPEVIRFLEARGFHLLRWCNQWGQVGPDGDATSWFGDYLFVRYTEPEATLAAEIVQQRRYRYRRVGFDERPIELLPNGRIGQGRAHCEQVWLVQERDGGGVDLLLLGPDRVTCRLVPETHGRFTGAWLSCERMPVVLEPLNPPYTLEKDLARHGRKVYSQNDEDGIIERILEVIGTRNQVFVEFGVGPGPAGPVEKAGFEANCRLLRERGWQGFFFDQVRYPPECGSVETRITALTINQVLRRHGVPHVFDVLSIDIDGQDFWVWNALIYEPRLVVIEYNANCARDDSLTIQYDVEHRWDGTKYFGASLLAMQKLGRSKGYALVYANTVNAFFVREELLANPEDFCLEDLYRHHDVHRPDPLDRPWVKV